MKITDEPEYFEASLRLKATSQLAEVSAYRNSGSVLMHVSATMEVAPDYRPTPGIRLTPSEAEKLGRYLLKASQLAKPTTTTTKRSTR
jgi:hypothetical protein